MSEPVRQGEPTDDDVCVQRIEVEFAIPVYIPQGALRELDGLLSSVIRMKMNQLVGHAHWISGYGSKPQWSQADAAFLGKTPADDAPLKGEPTWDDSVYHIETTCIERPHTCQRRDFNAIKDPPCPACESERKSR